MYLINPPRPVMPITMRMSPAINEATMSPSGPCVATIGASNGTNAPAGPPTCTSEPPSAEIRIPATTEVKIPISGFSPEAIASAIASGRATRPTVAPAVRSASKSWRE